MVDAAFVGVLDDAAIFVALESALDSADIVVSPVDVLSTGDAGAAVVVVETVFAESDAAMVLSVCAASFRAHAAARLRAPATTNARPTTENGGDMKSSKERFIGMLIHSCTLP